MFVCTSGIKLKILHLHTTGLLQVRTVAVVNKNQIHWNLKFAVSAFKDLGGCDSIDDGHEAFHQIIVNRTSTFMTTNYPDAHKQM